MTLQGLSEREHAVLKLIAAGMRVKEIGRTLNLSPNTISTYSARINRKLNARTSAQAIAVYYRLVFGAQAEYDSWLAK